MVFNLAALDQNFHRRTLASKYLGLSSHLLNDLHVPKLPPSSSCILIFRTVVLIIKRFRLNLILNFEDFV